MTDDVSALYVRADGPYPKLVRDWWDGSPGRDAREYAGPRPVVAHPPCARWGRFWWSAQHRGLGLGDDEGCFAAAIAAVRRWGGILEHPEASHAWPRFGIMRPTRGTWTRSLLRPDEWVTEVDQLAYGHRARKRTWLVLVGDPVPLRWDHAERQSAYLLTPRLGRRVYSSGPGPSRTAELRALHGIELMGKREREVTPWPFARWLVALAGGSDLVEDGAEDDEPGDEHDRRAAERGHDGGDHPAQMHLRSGEGGLNGGELALERGVAAAAVAELRYDEAEHIGVGLEPPIEGADPGFDVSM